MKLYQLLSVLSENKYTLVIEDTSGIERRKIEIKQSDDSTTYQQAKHEEHRVIAYDVTDVWFDHIANSVKIHICKHERS